MGKDLVRKVLDLDTVLDSGKKVYVQSNVIKSNLLMVLQVKDKSGRSRSLKVPPIRFPVCVSTQFSKDSIRDCADLRDCLSKNVLVLVEEEEAERMLKSAEAQDEMKAYQVSVYSDTAPKNAVRDNMQRLKKESEGASNVVDSADVLGNDTLQGGDVNPRVLGLVASLISKEKNSKETLTHLKRLKGAMTEADLTYIIKECEKETQVREFAEETLAGLSSGDGEE